MQSRRTFLKQSLALFGAGLMGRAAAQRAQQPNFLFLFADDQSYETIQALGCSEIHTPNLNRLVRAGTTFTNAYNMGAWGGAVCVASRTMLLTGRSLWQANEANNKQEGGKTGISDMVRDRQLWPQLLEDVGYDTYMTGKWHVSTDAAGIFNDVRDVRGGMPKQTPEGYNRPRDEAEYNEAGAWKPWDAKHGGFWEGGKHWSEVVADHAIDFIEAASKKDNPFFMYTAFNAPHDPRQSPKKFIDMYPLDKVSVPENFLPNYPYDEEIGCNPTGLRDERLAPSPRTEYSIKVNRQEYYAIITHMDEQVGRILDALEASGKADNTYIFFTADHGLSVGHHGLIGKQNMYDHSLRVPLMVTGPGIPKNRLLAGDVYLQDIMPTTLELAGAKKPGAVFFNSLMPMVRGECEENYESIYGGYTKVQRAVRVDGYKLIVYPKAKATRLYNLEQDPQEMNDLANDPKHAGLKKRMFKKLLALQKDLEDTLDIASVFPDLQ